MHQPRWCKNLCVHSSPQVLPASEGKAKGASCTGAAATGGEARASATPEGASRARAANAGAMSASGACATGESDGCANESTTSERACCAVGGGWADRGVSRTMLFEGARSVLVELLVWFIGSRYDDLTIQ